MAGEVEVEAPPAGAVGEGGFEREQDVVVDGVAVDQNERSAVAECGVPDGGVGHGHSLRP